MLQVDARQGLGDLANLPDLGDVVLVGHKERPFLLATPGLFRGKHEDADDHGHTLVQKREDVDDHDHTLIQEREDVYDHGDLPFSREEGECP